MSVIQDLYISLVYPDYQDGFSSSNLQKQFYSPGDYMEGVVLLNLNTSLRVKALYINVLGQAHTAWENSGKRKTYEEAETHLDHSECIMDAGHNAHNFPKGFHRFAFRFHIPHTVPSTFHGTYGSVTYIARVTLDTEDDMMKKVTSQPFMILRRDPVPQEAYNPVDMSKSKVYLGLEVGKIKVTLNLDHTIAVPGEALLVNAEVSNWSGKDITMLEGSLIQEATYYAMRKKIVFRQYLSKRQDLFDVNLKWGRKWTDVKVHVPPHLADSGLRACNIIHVKYIFQFRAQIRGQDDIVLESPLYVGYHQDDDMPQDPKVMLMNRMLMDTHVQPIRRNRPN